MLITTLEGDWATGSDGADALGLGPGSPKDGGEVLARLGHALLGLVTGHDDGSGSSSYSPFALAAAAVGAVVALLLVLAGAALLLAPSSALSPALPLSAMPGSRSFGGARRLQQLQLGSDAALAWMGGKPSPLPRLTPGGAPLLAGEYIASCAGAAAGQQTAVPASSAGNASCYFLWNQVRVLL